MSKGVPRPSSSPDASAGGESEIARLLADADRRANWKRWGPYLAERQWGTVREDYSADGDCWNYFPHDHARSRAYRWGEDGLLGITDRECRLCFALALWNGHDPILKERLFGLTGPEGNHGEDVKEHWWYLDSTPTHSWLRAMYRYPHAAYPYEQLVQENRRRGLQDREFELADTGVLDGERFCDVEVEYAKAAPDDVLVRITVHNRGSEAVSLHLLPQLWFRNTWSWGRTGEGYWQKPSLRADGPGVVSAEHETLGRFRWHAAPVAGELPELLFTENETNVERLFAAPNPQPYVKDAFHRRVVNGDTAAVNPARTGTKAAAWYRLQVPAYGRQVVELRLQQVADGQAAPFGAAFDAVVAARRAEAEAFYRALPAAALDDAERVVHRQACAGLLWSKQFYHLDVAAWLAGDPAQPPPPAQRRQTGRNADWQHLYNRDVVSSVPDKWEYPWYAAWDLAFHTVAVCREARSALRQGAARCFCCASGTCTRTGQLPAYEFAFGDVNPRRCMPGPAGASIKMTGCGRTGGRSDRAFLAKVFHKLLLNFTWWVNRKDRATAGTSSAAASSASTTSASSTAASPLPTGGHARTGRRHRLDGVLLRAPCSRWRSSSQSDDPAYEDVASKFFEHFVAITAAINARRRAAACGTTGTASTTTRCRHRTARDQSRCRVRSLVGLIPIVRLRGARAGCAGGEPAGLPQAALQWFLANRPHLARHLTCMSSLDGRLGFIGACTVLLAIPSTRAVWCACCWRAARRARVPFAVRRALALGRCIASKPYRAGGRWASSTGSTTSPGEGNDAPVRRQQQLARADLDAAQLPASSRRWSVTTITLARRFMLNARRALGHMVTLAEAADELRRRLISLWLPDERGRAPVRRGCANARARGGARLLALPRALSRRHGTRAGREPPDGMDGADRTDCDAVSGFVCDRVKHQIIG
jgi:hypothetical protein